YPADDLLRELFRCQPTTSSSVVIEPPSARQLTRPSGVRTIRTPCPPSKRCSAVPRRSSASGTPSSPRTSDEPDRTIALEAITAALDDAGLSSSDVDGLVKFTMETTELLPIRRRVLVAKPRETRGCPSASRRCRRATSSPPARRRTPAAVRAGWSSRAEDLEGLAEERARVLRELRRAAQRHRPQVGPGGALHHLRHAHRVQERAAHGDEPVRGEERGVRVLAQRLHE